MDDLNEQLANLQSRCASLEKQVADLSLIYRQASHRRHLNGARRRNRRLRDPVPSPRPTARRSPVQIAVGWGGSPARSSAGDRHAFAGPRSILAAVTRNGISKLVFTILSAVAENERDRIRERIRDVKRHLASQSVYGGGKRPFGFEVANDRLVPNANEQAAICL